MKRKKNSKPGRILILIAAILITGLILLYSNLWITDVTIKGNQNIPADMIVQLLFQKKSDKNLLTAWLTQGQKEDSIPMIEALSYSFDNLHAVTVTVKEKEAVASLQVKGKWYYFDDEGYFLAAFSGLRNEIHVPQILGLRFEEPELYSKLTVLVPQKHAEEESTAEPSETKAAAEADEEIVKEQEELVYVKDSGEALAGLLKILGMLSENGITPNQLIFGEDNELSIVIGNVTVYFGEQTSLAAKFSEFAQMQDKLTGLRGILHMENFEYSTDDKTFIFERN